MYAPCNPDFVRAIKGIGGKRWEPSKRCWSVPDTAVREIMMDVYGYSDQIPNDVLVLKVAFLSGVSSTCSDVTLVGDGVAYIRDGASGGGSVKNWRSIVEEGSIAILSNMNKHIYEKAEADSDIQVEVVETSASGNDR